MRTKGLVSAAVFAVLVVTCSVAVPMVAEADVGSEPTSTQISCPGYAVAGSALNCVLAVSGTTTNTPPPNGDVLTISFDHAGVPDVQCVLDNGSCTVSVALTSAAEGLLTVTATYPGDAGYDASSAETMVDVFQPTRLVAKPAIANLVSPTKVNLELSARLTDASDNTPIAGASIQFWPDGGGRCDGLTDASGVATCSSIEDVIAAASGYEAVADGGYYQLYASARGPGVRI